MQLKLIKMRVNLEKVFLRFAIIEKKINVHHGLFKQAKCFTTVRKKQYITIMP